MGKLSLSFLSLERSTLFSFDGLSSCLPAPAAALLYPWMQLQFFLLNWQWKFIPVSH
jgi:hypothetical protein